MKILGFISCLSWVLYNYFESLLRSVIEPYCLSVNMGPWFCNPELFWSIVGIVKSISMFCLIVCPVIFLSLLIKKWLHGQASA